MRRTSKRPATKAGRNKVRPRSFVIQDPVFRTSHLIGCGLSLPIVIRKFEKLSKLVIPKENYEPGTSNARMIARCGSGGSGLIWFREACPSASIIAHEAFHLAYFVLSERDTPLCEATEEVYAYFQQFIITQIVNKVW